MMTSKRANGLENEEITRYSRQLILPEIGVQGQLTLKKTSVLIVGAGGLGCPCAIYLAAAGLGKLGLVDYDDVELNNLHRQILHTEERVNVSKADSAAQSISQLNSLVTIETHRTQLNKDNAKDIIEKYEVIVDATDNVATRYLLNDACVLLKKPLVSGSALRFEGQLTVYSHEGGPCYRCLFPSPPPPDTVTNCSDGGVLGVVPGVIGTLQALEVMKIALKIGEPLVGRLLLFDALPCSFRTIKLRPRKDDCLVCGKAPKITQLIDYEEFCGAPACDKDAGVHLLEPHQRLSVQALQEILQRKERQRHLLIDVRSEIEMDICALPESLNVPMSKLENAESISMICAEIAHRQINPQQDLLPVYVVCRKGNDSQKAVKLLEGLLKDKNIDLKDIKGGLHAWTREVDSSFPIY
ncbi:unnamed protein product [Darwinula stevensoni]|uniref:Adenylyltransferase and sulfurtransferase MOCS3 homolog n=1 Tax=Darwinula stevensoni TaxID=69355 RepID=A0A7R8X075_9CRUS|nr:unnamed protein product [Darwinula stevensoni]CAG0881368.1 unnamed protein product [Darwinula stevensoni]